MASSTRPPARFRPATGETLRLTFLGAAREVTGSCLLVETARSRLLVDCGLFQGARGGQGGSLARRNAGGLNFARSLDAVLLTHAHLDHSGRLPLLVQKGYGGSIFSSEGTRELAEIMLRDAAHVQESDAARASKRRQRQGHGPVQPLYGQEEVEAALGAFEARPMLSWFPVSEDTEACLVPAGHILGAANVALRVRGPEHTRTLLVSGDLGREHDLLMAPPAEPPGADVVVLESTYGDREHKDLDATLEEFEGLLTDALAQGGSVIVPVFAVGRAQEILHHLASMVRRGVLEGSRIVLDSPMAIGVTELYGRHSDCLRRRDGEALCLELPEGLRQTRTQDASMALNRETGLVLLSASGMCEGGRILHHLKHRLWRESTHLVFVGFQAAGTLGRALVDGARKVRVLGEPIAVKARVHTLGGFSAHADQRELLAWLGRLPKPPERVALVHGEERGAAGLEAAVRRTFGWPVERPAAGDSLIL
jgi:metallo-beta-lactamase family protein